MAYKQESCPLCGRNMTAIETHPGRGELYCSHCDLSIGGNDAKTPEELIALMDSSEHRRLKDENTKLRELVSGLEYCVQGSLCDCCPLYDPLGTNHRRCESLEHELGIEV